MVQSSWPRVGRAEAPLQCEITKVELWRVLMSENTLNLVRRPFHCGSWQNSWGFLISYAIDAVCVP